MVFPNERWAGVVAWLLCDGTGLLHSLVGDVEDVEDVGDVGDARGSAASGGPRERRFLCLRSSLSRSWSRRISCSTSG